MLNINWEKSFSGQILSRGLKYYKSGRVDYYNDLQNKRVVAEVQGTEEYNVAVSYDDRARGMRMACDCPYSVGGGYCKHMAAVLYAMENDSFDYIAALKNDEGSTSGAEKESSASRGGSENKERSRKTVNPFADNKPGNTPETYQYFDFARLTKNLKITEELFSKAVKLCESDRPSDQTDFAYFPEGARERDSAVLEATLQIKKTEAELMTERKVLRKRGNPYRYYMGSEEESFDVGMRFNRNSITSLHCDCPACRYSRGLNPQTYYYSKPVDEVLCEHIVALLIQTDRFIRENHPGDATSLEAQRLLKCFSTTSHKPDSDEEGAAITQKLPVISLLPMIQEDYYGIRVSFKVGREKMYMLKSRFDLTDAEEESGTLLLGKNNVLDFSRETFRDDFSRGLYEMLEASVNEDRARGDLFVSGGLTAGDYKSTMLLMGHNLDAFFDICNGMNIERKSPDKDAKSVVLKNCNPRMKFSIMPVYSKEKTFQGIRFTGSVPKLIKGARYSYVFSEDSICRVSPEYAKAVKALTEYGKGFDITIGRKNLGTFYRTILPELSVFADIDDSCGEDISEYLPPEAAFRFFLDVRNKMPVCAIKSVYGDKEYNALEALTLTGGMTIIRDADREREIVNAIRPFFGIYDPETNLVCCSDEAAVYDLLDEGLSLMLKLGEVSMTDAFRRLKIRPRTKISIGVSAKSDMLELAIESEDISREELLQMLNSYKLKKKYYRLKNGEFTRLEDDGLEELSAIMDAMHLSPREFVKGNMKLPLYRALYLDKMLEQNSSFYSERDKNFRNLVRDFKTVSESDYEVPAKLEKVLRSYQAFGFKWLKTVENCHFGGILADDMGLGKTLQIISLLLDAKERSGQAGEPGSPALIVSPASLVYNWKAEFERFAPELKVCTVTGTQGERAKIVEGADSWDAMITSYDLLKRDIAEYDNIEFSYEIIDEAQYIKNHTTAAAKAVKVIRSKQRFALTGTPIENRLAELWSIFDYLMPGFLYGYDVFRKEFETPIAKNNGEKRLEQLRRMVSPFILRRLKKDVLSDIPDKLEEVYYARLEGTQRKVYDAEVTKIRQNLEKTSDEEFGRGKLEILAELTRIRQICCDPHLLFEDYEGASAKKDTCLELIRSAIEGEHKVLVFSQFTSMLEILEAALTEENIGYYKITGQTSKEHRLELVNAFNDGNDGISIFLISLKAGGTGLNLTGADIVIHFDPWWNVAAQNQATDRAHRIGQTKVVSVYKLIAKDTIEEKIQKLQENKQNLADSILSGETGGLVGMTREEVMDLLSDNI